MKKFIAGFICCFILMTGMVFAATQLKAGIAGFKIFVDGKEFKPGNPAVVIDGRTYLPLRSMGEALKVKVNWNDVKKQVEVGEPPIDEVTIPAPTPTTPENITLGKNEFLSKYNANAEYEFKFTILGKVQENMTGTVPYEVWQFKCENINRIAKTFDIYSFGWNQGTAITTVTVPGYNQVNRKKLQPGESFTAVVVLEKSETVSKIMFFYDAGKLLEYQE